MTSQEPVRILCIEDNPVNWRLVQRLLAQAGYQMHWAPDGTKGLEMALTLRPALILLDINLPGLSGFEVATKVHQYPELQGIPVVALTARTLKSDRETALVAGCDGFISKPLDPFTFVRQVEAYLGGVREHLDKSRQEPALRQFNVHVVEHLETQLKEAVEANRKLVAAQEALEARNRSLARLLALSQSVLSEREPKTLLLRVLSEVRTELRASGLWAYRMHPSGSYFEGLRWTGSGFDPVPVLSLDHPFVLRARGLSSGTALQGADLRGDRVWDEGQGLGFWSASSESCMLVLRDHQADPDLFGFWIVTRPSDQPFLGLELELVTLHASIAMVSLENAELIANLNDSTRALAASYERLETSYLDLQNARNSLHQRSRHELMGELIFKIAQRLETPVASLHRQSQVLDQVAVPGPGPVPEAQPKALAEIREAVFKIDGLLKAMLRRVGRGGPPVPEWLDLHDLVQQELALLQVDGVIPAEVSIVQELAAGSPLIHGVYDDFAAVLLYLVQHALGGPTPSAVLSVRSIPDPDRFVFQVRDEGGPILPDDLAAAFEPFSELHPQHPQLVIGSRSPGEGLVACKQLLVPYLADISIANEGDGTLVELSIPLH